MVEEKSHALHADWKGLVQTDFLSPFTKMFGALEAEYMMREIHEGSCRSRVERRILAWNVLLARYF